MIGVIYGAMGEVDRLKSVLEDGRRRGVKKWVSLGANLGSPESSDRIMALLGTFDVVLKSVFDDLAATEKAYAFGSPKREQILLSLRDSLTDMQKNKIRLWPSSAEYDGVFFYSNTSNKVTSDELLTVGIREGYSRTVAAGYFDGSMKVLKGVYQLPIPNCESYFPGCVYDSGPRHRPNYLTMTKTEVSFIEIE